jgi:hypothetical protein
MTRAEFMRMKQRMESTSGRAKKKGEEVKGRVVGLVLINLYFNKLVKVEEQTLPKTLHHQ